MPRQTFATRQFFVNACESTTQQKIISLPDTFLRLQLVGENSKLHCIRFLHAPDDQRLPIHISVSVLPLHDTCTKVTVHGSYPDGCAFTNDPYMETAVANVEAALQAAMNGDAAFEPSVVKKKLAQRYRIARQSTAVFISNALRPRNLSRPSHS